MLESEWSVGVARLRAVKRERADALVRAAGGFVESVVVLSLVDAEVEHVVLHQLVFAVAEEGVEL